MTSDPAGRSGLAKESNRAEESNRAGKANRAASSDRAGDPNPSGDAYDSLGELGRISAELLHDMGSVLSVLEGRVALARSEATLGRPTSPELRRIQRDTRQLRRMVLEIVDELRQASRSPEMALPVKPLVEDEVNRWIAAAPLLSPSLRISVPAGTNIYGPPTFFTRTLGNLLRNASRHAQGEIRITVRALEEERILETVVEDDGAGVAEELRPHIFDPLVSGEHSHTGLGLSFARWAAERLGGEISADRSADLGGASFCLRIPLAPREGPARSAPGSPLTQGQPLLSGRRVAIIEDEAAIVRVLRRRLEAEGAWVVAPALPAPDDVDTLLGELGAAEPDVILMDLNLGVVSGLTLHETMSHRRPELGERVVFLTGGPLPESEGGPPAISKLAEWDQIVGKIQEVAERRG